MPNNLIPATVESFHNLYPTANVCFANEKSFEPEKTYDDYMSKYEFVEKMIGKEELERCLANEQIEVNITNSEEINEMKHKLTDINNKLQELKVELNV